MSGNELPDGMGQEMLPGISYSSEDLFSADYRATFMPSWGSAVCRRGGRHASRQRALPSSPNSSPPDRLGWAFGITSTSSALGVATGAPIGGLITGYLSWHWVFFINIPVGVAAIFTAIHIIPDDSPAKSPGCTKRAKGTLRHSWRNTEFCRSRCASLCYEYGQKTGVDFPCDSPFNRRRRGLSIGIHHKGEKLLRASSGSLLFPEPALHLRAPCHLHGLLSSSFLPIIRRS